MIDDVIDNILKKGMSRIEITNKLGKPNFDGIGSYLPKQKKIPDSLELDYARIQSDEEKEKILRSRTLWYNNNYKSAPMLDYHIGWSLADAISLQVILDQNDIVTDFWIKQH